jgi:hypothetical protein
MSVTPEIVQLPAGTGGGEPRAEPETATTPDTECAPDRPAGQTIVEMAVFGRSIRVEAAEPLTTVSATAVDLWQHIGAATPTTPAGASGFVYGEQPGMEPVYEPYGTLGTAGRT